MNREVARLALCTLALIGFTGCRASERPPRPPFVAVWLDRDSATLTAGELGRLRQAGADELFVEAGQLSWEKGVPRLAVMPMVALPATEAGPWPATLVVSGVWSRADERAAVTARSWSASLQQMVDSARSHRLEPRGVQFELDAASDYRGLAEVLERLRGGAARHLVVSVALSREALDVRGVEQLIASVDYWTVNVWGHPPGVDERPEDWDIDRTVMLVAAVERLGRPYAIAAWTLGTAYWRTADGRVAAEDPSIAITPVVRDPAMVRRGEVLLEGIDRQVDEWRASDATVVGSWRLAAGEAVRFVRPSTADLEELLERTGAVSSSLRLGTILRRLPGRLEPLALSVDNLVTALTPGAAQPQLEIDLVPLPGARGRVRFRLVLINGNDEPTDFGGFDSNYVELRATSALFAGAERGDFGRTETSWRGLETRTLRAVREPDTLRLFAPRVGGRERFESGAIELRSRLPRPVISVRGVFFLPSGSELHLAERNETVGDDN